MREVFKIAGSLLVVALLIAHFLLIALIVAPTDKLLGLIIESDQGFLGPEEIPGPVEDFLVANRVVLNGDYELDNSDKGKLVSGVLQLRKEYLMDPAEQIALDANLLNYGEGLIGIESASEYYYGKPLSEVSDREWITLVNLHNIYLTSDYVTRRH